MHVCLLNCARKDVEFPHVVGFLFYFMGCDNNGSSRELQSSTKQHLDCELLAKDTQKKKNRQKHFTMLRGSAGGRINLHRHVHV